MNPSNPDTSGLRALLEAARGHDTHPLDEKYVVYDPECKGCQALLVLEEAVPVEDLAQFVLDMGEALGHVTEIARHYMPPEPDEDEYVTAIIAEQMNDAHKAVTALADLEATLEAQHEA